MTAGYWSRVTGGAGGVSLLTAGEKHADVANDLHRVVVPDTVSIINISVSQWFSLPSVVSTVRVDITQGLAVSLLRQNDSAPG